MGLQEMQQDGPPRCYQCGNLLEAPADVEEGYHFLCVVPTVDDVHDEGGESGC
jgi:hypothetical protein